MIPSCRSRLACVTNQTFSSSTIQFKFRNIYFLADAKKLEGKYVNSFDMWGNRILPIKRLQLISPCFNNWRVSILTSVTSKKSPNVYKSCPNMISLEKLKIFTPLFGQISCYQRLCKVAQSLINCPICSHWSVHCFISEEVLFFLLRNGLNKAARICVTIFHSHNGPIVPAGGIVLSCVVVCSSFLY